MGFIFSMHKLILSPTFFLLGLSVGMPTSANGMCSRPQGGNASGTFKVVGNKQAYIQCYRDAQTHEPLNVNAVVSVKGCLLELKSDNGKFEREGPKLNEAVTAYGNGPSCGAKSGAVLTLRLKLEDDCCAEIENLYGNDLADFGEYRCHLKPVPRIAAPNVPTERQLRCLTKARWSVDESSVSK